MSSKLRKPEKGLVVLILGGTTTVARSLAVYLLDEEKRAVFVRIADRFSVHPATTYLDKEFRALLDAPDSLLEYKQINLANKANHGDVFAPPSEWAGHPTGWVGFDVVYDLTGETGFDKPELMQISNTYQLAISLATSASHLSAAQLPKAYVRLTFPFYEMKSLSSSSPGHDESSDLRPDGIRGRWWHETQRGLAKITNLNTGVIRCGAWYGRGTWEGEVVPRLVVGQVYKHLKEEMKFLYNSDLRIHTVHSIDIAQSLYLLSLYLIDTPRETVLKQTAVDIPFSFSPPPSSTFSLGSNKRSSLGESWKTVKTVVQDKEKVRIPLFNVVDEGDTTQDKLARAVAEVWDIKYGFLNSTMASLVQSFAKTDFNDMIDDVNEMHVEAWSDMLSASDPPILSTPISPFLGEHAFRKHAICFDGSKAKQILGFQPIMPKIQIDELRAIVKGFQDDQLWPG